VTYILDTDYFKPAAAITADLAHLDVHGPYCTYPAGPGSVIIRDLRADRLNTGRSSGDFRIRRPRVTVGGWPPVTRVYCAGMTGAVAPKAGMMISIRTRRDVVVVDPDRFLATARQALRDRHPGLSEAAATEAVADVYDAVHALLDRDGDLAADAVDNEMVGVGGPLPGVRVSDRSDGLSPAGRLQQVVFDDAQPLQDYGLLPSRGSLRGTPCPGWFAVAHVARRTPTGQRGAVRREPRVTADHG
jgi:hypothetical protein